MRRPVAMLAALVAAACASGTGSPAPSPAATPAPRAAADPARLAYTAGTFRYRVEQQSQTVQEMMGQTQEIAGTVTMVVTEAVAADGANLAATFTIDSIHADSGLLRTGANFDVLRGKSVRMIFTPAGRRVSVSYTDSLPQIVQLVEDLDDFFPALPPMAIAAGATWIDTVNNTTNLGEIQLTSRAIRTHRVVGWEARDGVRALHVATSGGFTVTGSGSSQGQELTLEGGGTNVLDRFVSAGGVFLGHTAQDSSLMNVTVVSMGLEIPVRRTGRATITRLP